MADPQIPQFMLDQLHQSMQGPPLTNGSQYGRWNGNQNNGFGLAPSGWPSLYGYHAPQQLPWQPPWGNNGAANSPIPGSTMPVLPQGQMPQLPGGQMPQLPSGGQLPQLPGNGSFTPVPGSSVLPKSSAPPPKVGMPSGPGMDPSNFGQAPQAPTGGPGQQYNFANSVATQSQSPTGRAFLQALQSGKYGPNAYAQYLASSPQSASVADFNRIAQSNPTMATQMEAAGGQQFRNAIMANNGWNNYQNNSFINQYGSGALPGFGG